MPRTMTDEQVEMFLKAVKLAGKKERMELHGHVFPMETRSDSPEPVDREEEDYSFAASDSLHDLVQDFKGHALMKEFGLDTWQKRLMFFLKPVAKHYGLNPDKLLRKYNRHFLPTHAMEAGLDPIPFINVYDRPEERNWKG